MDETAVSTIERRVKVIVPRQQKKVPKIDLQSYSHHITLIMCISADGTALPVPTVILPLSTLPQLGELCFSYNWSGSESGWITAAIWSQWITEVFIPYVQQKRTSYAKTHNIDANNAVSELPCLLYLDSHSSRLDEYAHKILEGSNITVVWA